MNRKQRMKNRTTANFLRLRNKMQRDLLHTITSPSPTFEDVMDQTIEHISAIVEIPKNILMGKKL